MQSYSFSEFMESGSTIPVAPMDLSDLASAIFVNKEIALMVAMGGLTIAGVKFEHYLAKNGMEDFANTVARVMKMAYIGLFSACFLYLLFHVRGMFILGR